MSEEKKSPTMKLMKKGASTAAKEATAPAEATETKAAAPAETQATESATAENATNLVAAGDDLIVQTAHEIENLKEDKAFKMVPTLLNNIDHDYFKLGGVLSVIQVNGWYMDKGYENFRAFVEAECGIQYRKAMYLIQIYNGLVESGVKWEQVKHLGWTKLKELADILSQDNVADWVATAEAMTVLQLQEHIKAATAGTAPGTGETKANTESEAKKTTTITFKVHADQKETVKAAIDKCKHETGTDVDAVAIEHICLDYLGGESKLKTVPTLAELMKGKSAEEVLTVFSEQFPDVSLEVTLPE